MRTKNIYPTQLVIKRQTKKPQGDSNAEAFLKATRRIATLYIYQAGNREISVNVSTPVKIGNGEPFYPNSITLNIFAISDLKAGKSFEIHFPPISNHPPVTEFNPGAFASLPPGVTDVDIVTKEWNTVVENNRYTFSKYKISETVRTDVLPVYIIEALTNMQSWRIWNTNDVLTFENNQSTRILTIKAGPNFPTGTVNAPLTIITDTR